MILSQNVLIFIVHFQSCLFPKIDVKFLPFSKSKESSILIEREVLFLHCQSQKKVLF